jgi:predicted dehydrogenase
MKRRTSVLGRRELLLAGGVGLSSVGLLPQASGKTVNERVQIGVIGLGSRGYNLIDALIRHHDSARIVAICDVDTTHYRDRAWGTGSAYGLIPAGQKIAAGYAKHGVKVSKEDITRYSDYRELLDEGGVDAVVIATPDHWHARCTLDAVALGKDVYCEKPVTHLFAEGQAVYREVEKRQAVFQTGSQQRSDRLFRRAVELVRNGRLGKVHTIKVGQQAGYAQPMGDSKLQKIPKQLDYDFWCGPSQVLPYMRARHHRWWRGHSAYGGGVLMDWIGHHNDIAHWALDLDSSGPEEVEAIGWTFPKMDIYDTPVRYTIRCKYAGGVSSTISSENAAGLELIGTEGSVFVNRGKLQTSDPRWAKSDFVPGPAKVTVSDDHMGNFLSCIRTRQEAIAPAEAGHRSITPGHLGYVSSALGRSLRWDAKEERVVGDEEADNKLRHFEYRQPWS